MQLSDSAYNSYTEDFTLSTLICDEDDRLTLWGLARLFQDVAGDHSDTLGVGFNGLKPQHKAWVLTHAYYSVLRLPTAGERLTLKTWAKIDNGLIAPRDYQLVDSDGVVCAASSSNWVILDMDKRRVCRLNEIIKVFDEFDVHSTKYDRLEKIKMPANLPHLKDVDVPYSSIDHTRHVNNAEYIKWICDSIPDICKSRVAGADCREGSVRPEIAELEINYLKETKFGDSEVKIFSDINAAGSALPPANTSSGNSLTHTATTAGVALSSDATTADSSLQRTATSADKKSFYFQITNSTGVAVNSFVTLR